MTDPLRATAALRTWNSVKFGLTHQRKPERASAREEKPLHCITPLIMQKIQAGGLVGEVSVKSVFDGKLVNNSRAGARMCLIPPAGVHISAHAFNACCVLGGGGGGGESATCTCWHSALSWSGCHHGGAEVTGTAWK